MDSIWFLRNKIIHEALTPNIENFVNGTLKIYKEHCEAWGNEQINKSHKGKPIPKDHYLLTFDVAVRSSRSTSTTICRSEEGTPIFVQAKQIKSQNPNEGEAMAMYIGVEEAKVKKIKKLLVAGYSQVTLQQ